MLPFLKRIKQKIINTHVSRNPIVVTTNDKQNADMIFRSINDVNDVNDVNGDDHVVGFPGKFANNLNDFDDERAEETEGTQEILEIVDSNGTKHSKRRTIITLIKNLHSQKSLSSFFRLVFIVLVALLIISTILEWSGMFQHWSTITERIKSFGNQFLIENEEQEQEQEQKINEKEFLEKFKNAIITRKKYLTYVDYEYENEVLQDNDDWNNWETILEEDAKNSYKELKQIFDSGNVLDEKLKEKFEVVEEIKGLIESVLNKITQKKRLEKHKGIIDEAIEKLDSVLPGVKYQIEEEMKRFYEEEIKPKLPKLTKNADSAIVSEENKNYPDTQIKNPVDNFSSTETNLSPSSTIDHEQLKKELKFAEKEANEASTFFKNNRNIDEIRQDAVKQLITKKKKYEELKKRFDEKKKPISGGKTIKKSISDRRKRRRVQNSKQIKKSNKKSRTNNRKQQTQKSSSKSKKYTSSKRTRKHIANKSALDSKRTSKEIKKKQSNVVRAVLAMVINNKASFAFNRLGKKLLRRDLGNDTDAIMDKCQKFQKTQKIEARDVVRVAKTLKNM